MSDENPERPQQRTFAKIVKCEKCGEDFRVLQTGHRIKAEGFQCIACKSSRYTCPVCMDSGHVLNVERAKQKQEAGPGTPSVWDPCPKGCTEETGRTSVHRRDRRGRDPRRPPRRMKGAAMTKADSLRKLSEWAKETHSDRVDARDRRIPLRSPRCGNRGSVMTKAESLKRLHRVARRESFRPFLLPYGVNRRCVQDARSHGLSAVRAIRYMEDDAIRRANPVDEPNRRYIISESRLAFRAACTAVGIKGPL